MRTRLILLLTMMVLLLSACSDDNSSNDDEGVAVPEATAESSSGAEAVETEPTAESTTPAEPTATAEVATATPTETALPEQPTDTTDSGSAEEVAEEESESESAEAELGVAADVPEMVWLPYSSGTYGNPVLTLQDGEIVYADEPDAIEAFFDYKDGRIAFGKEFWYAADNGVDAVTDLWVYDYAAGGSELWLDGNVGRAEWSPTDTVLAIALHNGTSFDLALIHTPGDWLVLNKDIDPFYSWSPDGQKIAFVRDGELFVTTLDGVESASLTSDMYKESSWVGDAPLWLPDYGLLAYAEFPVTFVSLDGVEKYEPIAADGNAMDENKRPFQMLWSNSQRQLIMQYEGMFGPSLQIFQFAEDIYTVDQVYDLGEGNELVGWYEGDESIIILQSGEPQIYSLLTHEITAP